MSYFYLALAIVAEVAATTALKATEGFTRLWPGLIVVAGYAISFYLLALVLRQLPVGITYAIWSGVGIVLISIVAAVLYRQIPDAAALLGMLLIISGVAVIHLYSDTSVH